MMASIILVSLGSPGTVKLPMMGCRSGSSCHTGVFGVCVRLEELCLYTGNSDGAPWLELMRAANPKALSVRATGWR
jgi:hypothetical protein